MFEVFTTADGWISLFTLILLEIVLGIDNVIFISILTNKLPKSQQAKGRNWGLILALGMRIILLMFISWIVGMTEPVLTLFEHGFSGRDLILLGGGLFLLYKSTVEIHDKIDPEEADDSKTKKVVTMGSVLMQIVLIDIVFSFDSILTAVGLSEHLIIMIIAVIVAMLVMIAFAKAISDFINQRPTLKVLALSFLIMIGVLLVLEAFHVEVPKGYIYFAMAFSFGVELLNLRIRNRVTKNLSEKNE